MCNICNNPACNGILFNAGDTVKVKTSRVHGKVLEYDDKVGVVTSVNGHEYRGGNVVACFVRFEGKESSIPFYEGELEKI